MKGHDKTKPNHQKTDADQLRQVAAINKKYKHNHKMQAILLMPEN